MRGRRYPNLPWWWSSHRKEFGHRQSSQFTCFTCLINEQWGAYMKQMD